MKTIKRITETGFVAVIRADSPEIAVKIAQACVEGGVKALEITFTVPKAEFAISKLSDMYKGTDILIGAGTVLDDETAALAIDCGAQFIVSPYLSIDVANLCLNQNVPYMPGAMTLTEVVKCMDAGAKIVKIFPGELFGPQVIKAFRGPMPGLKLMPTGGVSLENIQDWIKAGVAAVGVGGNLTASAKTGDFATITKIASEFMAKISEVRGR